MSINTAVIALSVEKRVPVDAAERFTVGQKVWAWVSVKNLGEASNLTMLWKHDGKVKSRVTLEVGTSKRWRTWSRRTMRAKDTGAWTVEVLDASGQLIETIPFEMTAN